MAEAISGGSGVIWAQRSAGSNNPNASGTLTLASGTGDATINFSARADVPASPFYNDAGTLDIANWVANSGGTNLDVVLIQLGANSSNKLEMSVAERYEWITAAKTLINAILAYQPTSKIIIALTSKDSRNPANWTTAKAKDQFQNNLKNLFKLIISEFDNHAYHANVYLGYAGAGLNRGNPPFTVDQFHPNTAGSKQLADAILPLKLKLINS